MGGGGGRGGDLLTCGRVIKCGAYTAIVRHLDFLFTAVDYFRIFCIQVVGSLGDSPGAMALNL